MTGLVVRVVEHDKTHIKLAMLLNGELITGACGVTLRNAELVRFIMRLSPEQIDVDRENISDDIFHRLAGFKNTRFV